MTTNEFFLLRLYEIQMMTDFENAAYLENGLRVCCPFCQKIGMMWDKESHLWYCPYCSAELDREHFFAHIQADPPREKCRVSCNENHPYCSIFCRCSDELNT